MKPSDPKHSSQDKHREKSASYKIDKLTFVVTPAYREDTDKTIHEVLLDMMIHSEAAK